MRLIRTTIVGSVGYVLGARAGRERYDQIAAAAAKAAANPRVKPYLGPLAGPLGGGGTPPPAPTTAPDLLPTPGELPPPPANLGGGDVDDLTTPAVDAPVAKPLTGRQRRRRTTEKLPPA